MTKIAIYSKGIKKIPYLNILLNCEITDNKHDLSVDYIGTWGIGKESNKDAEFLSNQNKIPLLRLEEGLIRAYSSKEPTLSLYRTHKAMYYDCNSPSNVEEMLLSDWKPSLQEITTYSLAKEMLIKYNISKYNDLEDCPENFILTNNNILLIDQTFGDQSITFGGANEKNFQSMLDFALINFKEANIYIKIHPEVFKGNKKGYLIEIINEKKYKNNKKIHIIKDNYNTPSLFKYFENIFVVTSQVGFDALVHKKNVYCFGLPFYSQWGITTDLHPDAKIKKHRSFKDIFIIMLLYSTRYINPFTNQRGDLLDLIEYISLQKRHKNNKTIKFYKTKLWRRSILEDFLNLNKKDTSFIYNTLSIKDGDSLATWGFDNFSEIPDGYNKLCIEDGFIRSFGLGSELEDPMSLVVDDLGIYFNPHKISRLEYILCNEKFTKYEKKQAIKIIQKLQETNLTKYNVGTIDHNLSKLKVYNKKIILVIGQVEDDASIKYGACSIKTNKDLLIEVLQNNPNTIIIYKPHPDVLTGNRLGNIPMEEIEKLKMEYKNIIHVETKAKITDCFQMVEEVHVITSTSGLEGLIRNKKVFTYGLPFYGGYGLTIDKEKFIRERKQISLEELILGCYILYPRYKLPKHTGFMNALSIINNISKKIGTVEEKIIVENNLFHQFTRKVKFCLKTIKSFL